MKEKRERARFRTIWISDLHLGTRACRVEPLLGFISSVECETLYLVGDVIDVWSLRRRFYWPNDHNDFIRKVLKRASNGTRVIFIPGNHDDVFRSYAGLQFGGVEIRQNDTYELLDGRRMLILHGDEFDEVVRNMHLITALGDWMYDWLLDLNRVLNAIRRRFGWPYWSLAGYVKQRVKRICQFVSGYQESVVRHARERNAQVVLAGHIHRPEITDLGDVLYCNCGDWVENCSAVVEGLDGALELIRFEGDRLADAGVLESSEIR